MKTIIEILFIIAFFMCGLTTGIAQQSLSSSGGNATGTGGSASYTVGQVVYTTNTGTSGSVSQGVQQTYEITITSSIQEADDIDLISTYPNPVGDQLKLKFEQEDFNGCKYHLYDLNGRIILSHAIIEKETDIFMEDLVPSTYFLKVFKDNKEIKTFKIVKIRSN